MIQRLGLDFGNTISYRPEGSERVYLPDSIRVITRLIGKIFGINAYIISKVLPGEDEMVLDFLKKNDFWNKVGISPDNIRFCRERHEKAPIARDLGITHMIDDRTEVLYAMHGIVPHRIAINPTKEQVDAFWDDGMRLVSDWIGVEHLLL